MRLGRPLAAASAVAAMTGASLIASPVLANSSNSNSPSTPSSTAEATTPPGSPAQPTPAPGKTSEATPTPGKTSEGSSFKITQEKTFVSASGRLATHRRDPEGFPPYQPFVALLTRPPHIFT